MSQAATARASSSGPGARDAAAPPARDRLWIAFAALALVASVLLAGIGPLLDPDEGRNAEVAREMLQGGDWQVPHLAGMAYLDKPPALFWAESAAMSVAGVNRRAARLPAALAGFALLLAFGALAARRRDPAFARAVVALAAAAPLYAVLSAYVIFDMPLALCVGLVIVGLVDELESGPSFARRLAMFAAVAAGVLVKGPVMLAWAAGGSLAAALLVRTRAPLAWLAWWPGWLVALGVPGAWFALATRRFPEYPHYAFLEESLERMATGHFHRGHGWWFVPAVLVAGALPWSLATPWARLRAPDRADRVMLGFVAFAAVFFTLSQSKLVTYLLPVVPPLAWLAARAGAGRRGFLRIGYAPAFTVALLIAGGPWLLRYARSQSGEPLAAAIHARAPGAAVVFEDCWSPGTDFALGRSSAIVAADPHVTTSTYQARYREALERRGQWTLRAAAAPGGPGAPAAGAPAAAPAGSGARDSMVVLVTPARSPGRTGIPIFTDGRFHAALVRACSVPE
ncbi:MAG TPA: glycosyltransferase family 39 protein [Candidatus Eisenbacteria bacterium]|nr:glycosyltransferase family 39 protein [Candidatus Eisenbacteria bacterium]